MEIQKKRKIQQRGSLLVDAACSFPVFIMALSLLLGLLSFVALEENTVYTQASAVFSEGKLSAAADLQADGLLRTEEHISYSGIFTELLDKGYGSTKALLYRSFSGADSGAGTEGGIVYIFPKSGKRYHIAGCDCLKDGSAENILSARVRKKYQPCQLCHPETLPEGAAVFLYTTGSRTYHRGTCFVVRKTYTSISLTQAGALGYSPCMLCCGGGTEDE